MESCRTWSAVSGSSCSVLFCFVSELLVQWLVISSFVSLSRILLYQQTTAFVTAFVDTRVLPSLVIWWAKLLGIFSYEAYKSLLPTLFFNFFYLSDRELSSSWFTLRPHPIPQDACNSCSWTRHQEFKPSAHVGGRSPHRCHQGLC